MVGGFCDTDLYDPLYCFMREDKTGEKCGYEEEVWRTYFVLN